MATLGRIHHEKVDGIRVGRFGPRINTSCYVYRLGDGLIDSGPPNQWRHVVRFASERRLRWVVLTHHHEDHCGNALRLARTFGAVVLAPRGTLPLLRDGFEQRIYQRIVWGRPARFEAREVPQEVELEGGFRLKSCPTPGHATDLTCYLEPDRGWLFSSDLFVATRPRYLRLDENPHREIASIDWILGFEFDTLLCAHRGVVEQGKHALEEKRDYLITLRDKALAMHRQGWETQAISDALLGKEDLTARITRGHYTKANYIRAFVELSSSR